ncbi:helix-turn-helix domain-containing protein [Streptomyces sp. ARC14]|uniref:hypothetical protein n=1 Tax=Streptomyces sp. ARC14 TaxID=2724152 RepID=UPI00385725FC
MSRLLLDGDVEGRYAGINDGEEGYRLTMALAVGASQPGRAWSPADFHRALLYTPTEGGRWARRLLDRKGREFTETKLTGMLLKARDRVAAQPPITCRQSGWEAVSRARAAFESLTWRCRDGGDTDLKNISVRLELCEKNGGLDHEVSLRKQAELMGCAKQTAKDSNERLTKLKLLVREVSGEGSNQGSKWRLVPPQGKNRAGVGHLPAPETRGGRDGVLPLHNDTRSLARIANHDAFHRYGHGTTGARLLACLELAEGKSAEVLRQELAVHRTTVSRRLTLLVADGLVVELEGLYYLAKPLAGPSGVQRAVETLDAAAELRGTAGAGEKRRQQYVRDRLNYKRWKADMRRRRQQERLRLVPEGAVDELTGEIMDPEWEGWDVSDPFRPVPLPEWAAAA